VAALFVTRDLAQFLVATRNDAIPAGIRHEGQRALLNWLGCAIGGCRDETVERARTALDPFSGPRCATLIGRGERVDVPSAALLNALASNILDFDDTHMPTVIHPSVPVAAAVFALAEHQPVPGTDLLRSFILGVETECRIGDAVSPGHYAAGWHITATCGVLGAAAAAGVLLGLNAQQMRWALGIAATQASGITAMMGSMSKSYNMAHAAHGGLMAAFLARENFTSSEQALEAPRGFAHVLGKEPQLERITDNLGKNWALSANAYKPFPCGIVLHAVIDGCQQLRAAHHLQADDIGRVDLRLHPLALELAGKQAPQTGLEGKLSAHHTAAVALKLGRAGVAEFTDICVRDKAVIALRNRVVTQADAALSEMEAHIAITLKNGQVMSVHVPHAIGTLERPMSDADLEAKFADLARDTLAPDRVHNLIALAWSLDTLPDASTLIAATLPATRA